MSTLLPVTPRAAEASSRRHDEQPNREANKASSDFKEHFDTSKNRPEKNVEKRETADGAESKRDDFKSDKADSSNATGHQRDKQAVPQKHEQQSSDSISQEKSQENNDSSLTSTELSQVSSKELSTSITSDVSPLLNESQFLRSLNQSSVAEGGSGLVGVDEMNTGVNDESLMGSIDEASGIDVTLLPNQVVSDNSLINRPLVNQVTNASFNGSVFSDAPGSATDPEMAKLNTQLFKPVTQVPENHQHAGLMNIKGNANPLQQGAFGSSLLGNGNMMANGGLLAKSETRLDSMTVMGDAISLTKTASSEVFSSAITNPQLSPHANISINVDLVDSSRLQMPVNIKFGHAQWGNMVAERTAMMVSQKIEFAELQLDPPELGPLQVKVSVTNDQTSVSFVASSSQVRDALEQTSNRLKELLEEQQLDLVDVDVSDQSEQNSPNDDDATQLSGHSADELEANSDNDTTNLVVESRYGVDHYA